VQQLSGVCALGCDGAVKGKGRRVGRDLEVQRDCLTVHAASAVAGSVQQYQASLASSIIELLLIWNRHKRTFPTILQAGFVHPDIVCVYARVPQCRLSNSDRPILHSWQHNWMPACLLKISEAT
jgi:hypothetical protein